jgi:3,2-trans-enoyl-CoA isomerase
VYKSRLATVSAIKGACPAGGCCLSLCCDLRVMTDFGHIGLNEVALGIPVPVYWARLMAKVVGQAAAEKLCLNATLASPQQALEVGLVDQVGFPFLLLCRS